MTVYTDYAAKHKEADRLVAMTKSHRHECGGLLTMAWDGKADKNGLRCGNCGILSDDAALVKSKSLTRRYREGEALHPAIANRIERTLGGSYMQSTQLMKMTQTAMIERAKKAKFPQDMTVRDYEVLADIAVRYGLDPLMQELTVYYGNVYVEIAGRRRKAQETKELAGTTVRPMTQEERNARWLTDGDFGSRSIVKRLLPGGFVAEHEGWAVIRSQEIQRNIDNARSHNKDPYFIPIVKEPQAHCDKRAEAAALKKGFSIPLPSAEDIDYSQDAPTVTVLGQDGKPVHADASTGEVKTEKPAEGHYRMEDDDIFADKPTAGPTMLPGDLLIDLQARVADMGGKWDKFCAYSERQGWGLPENYTPSQHNMALDGLAQLEKSLKEKANAKSTVS